MANKNTARSGKNKPGLAWNIFSIVTAAIILISIAAIALNAFSFVKNSQEREKELKILAEATPTPTPEPTPEPTPTPVPPSYTVRITATGDCTIGGNILSSGYENFDKVVRENGYDYFFDNVRHIFEDDDLTIINFESTIPDEDDTPIGVNAKEGVGFNFKSDIGYTNILTGSSIELCNIANNHILDYGESGKQSTIDNLEAAGLGVLGFEKVYYTEINGVKVIACGFTEWRSDMKESVATVKQLREQCDLLIVNMHWGVEKWNDITDEQEEWGHAMVDAGADIVIGNHSHVISRIEHYKDKYIIYSLGNFCFGGNRYPDDKDCFIFQQEFKLENGAVVDNGIKVIPCSISSVSGSNNFQPTPLEGDEYDRVYKKIQRWSKVDAEKMIFLDDEPYRTDKAAAVR